MQTLVRYVLYAVVAFQAFFAVATFFRWPVATNLWPFEGTTPLTYIFISSIFAAAASTLWAAALKQYGALAGIALDYVTILAPMAVFTFAIGEPGFGVATLFGTVFGVALLAWSLTQPLDRSIPLPGLVRWSFVVFILALLFVAVRLFLQHPNVIPWTITPDIGVVIGMIFCGAATYFIYTLLRPSWANAGGQLAGFLAYDVVLIVPFLQRLPTAAPEHRLGLIIYTLVVSYSGLLAIYYLFINRTTRIWGARPAAAALAPGGAPSGR